jgi:hypothetical protein
MPGFPRVIPQLGAAFHPQPGGAGAKAKLVNVVGVGTHVSGWQSSRLDADQCRVDPALSLRRRCGFNVWGDR